MDAREIAAWWKARGEAELEQLLFWRWDPLGVSDMFPNATGEYSAYAWPLAKLAIDGADAEVIADAMAALERGPMGLGPAPGRGERHRREVAAAILAWHAESAGLWAAGQDPMA
jgi:hypothetical protein